LLGLKEGRLTMEGAQKYRVVAWWSSGRTGLAKSNSAPNAIHFTAPPEFGGLEGRWTPEDLLLSAVASCYTTTFHALANYSKLEYADLEVEVEGMILKTDSGYSFSEIVIRPSLTISSEEEQTRALRLLQKAKTMCLVSRAISVEQKFEPHVQAGEPRKSLSRSCQWADKGRRAHI
jgi:peroxiredoxin-like protein